MTDDDKVKAMIKSTYNVREDQDFSICIGEATRKKYIEAYNLMVDEVLRARMNTIEKRMWYGPREG